jgi:hypothetical protein
MSSNELPPPAPLCLERPYPSSQKGGTLIAEDVADLAAHRKRLSEPDGYRPRSCPRCYCLRLHAHDFRERQLRGDPDDRRITVRRYRCTGCGGCWQILPRLVARWLWRSWSVVEQALGLVVGVVFVPEQTLRRWRRRLSCEARSVVQALAASARPALECVAAAIGVHATRRALVERSGQALAGIGALVHRLMPGLRLM